MALIGVICAAGLSSCGDDDNSWCGHKHVAVEQPAADEENHAAPDQTVEAQQKELLDYMIFTIGDKVRQQAAQPMWREDVRDMRNKLEAYLTHLKETGADAMTIVRLGLLLADATLDMAAYSRAEGLYQDTLKDLDALPEDVRAGVPARRIRSALSNGIGSCYLMQRKFTEALPHYEEALRLDKELYDSLAPADGQPLPEGEEMSDDLAQVAADVLSSYRCLGECQALADDPEQARETYQKGNALAVQMTHLRPGMSIQYIRLLSALGNLESGVGEPKKALAAWARAAKVADMLRRPAPTPAIRLQAMRFLRELEASAKAVQPQIRQQEEETQQTTEQD